MKTVKFLKAFPGFAEGQVVEVDEASADVLIKRKDAVAVDYAPERVLDLSGSPVVVVADTPAPVEAESKQERSAKA